MAYELFWEHRGVNKRFSGLVSAEEFLTSVAEVQRSAEFRKARYVINDFSEVTAHGLTAEDWEKVARLYCDAHQENPNCRIFFVTQDEALARLVINYSVDDTGSYELVITTTVAQARHCLETQPARLRRPRKYGYQSFLAR